MNKSELKAIFINAKATDAKYIGVSIQTEDSSQPEIIINPNANFDAKFDYYMEAYDDDLILIAAKGKKDIRITAAGQGNRFEDIECQLLGERGRYDFKWLYAGKFAEGISEEASTKEGKLSPTTKSVKGSFYERSLDNAYEISVDESNLVTEDTKAAEAIKNWFSKVQEKNGGLG